MMIFWTVSVFALLRVPCWVLAKIRKQIINKNIMKLSVRAMAMACGFTSGFGVLLLGLTAAILGWGVEMVEIISNLYLGMGPTAVGVVVGAIWAFIDGFIFGAIFAAIYNKFV